MTIPRPTPLTLDGAVARCLRLISDRRGYARYVATMNLQHLRMLQTDRQFQAAYRGAAFVTADGWPVAWLYGCPGRVAGSDLVPALFDRRMPLRVFLLGAQHGRRKAATFCVEERWPHITISGGISPLPGFEHDEAECLRIVKHINDLRTDVVLVALGAPRQELWCQRWAASITAPLMIPCGSVIDQLGGAGRAPAWAQRYGLEWAWRMLREPLRLAPRYALDAKFLMRMLLAEEGRRIRG